MPSALEQQLQQLRRELAVRPVRVPSGGVETRRGVALFLWDWAGAWNDDDNSLCHIDGNDTPVAASYAASAVALGFPPGLGWYEYHVIEDGTAIAIGTCGVPLGLVTPFEYDLVNGPRTAILAGHAIFLRDDGGIYRWGWTYGGELPGGPFTTLSATYDAPSKKWFAREVAVTASSPLMPVWAGGLTGPIEDPIPLTGFDVTTWGNQFRIVPGALGSLYDVSLSATMNPSFTYYLSYNHATKKWVPELYVPPEGSSITFEANRGLMFSDGSLGPKTGDVTISTVGDDTVGSLRITGEEPSALVGNYNEKWVKPGALGAVLLIRVNPELGGTVVPTWVDPVQPAGEDPGDDGAVLFSFLDTESVMGSIWTNSPRLGNIDKGGGELRIYYAAQGDVVGGRAFLFNYEGTFSVFWSNGNYVALREADLPAGKSNLAVKLVDEDVCVDGAWKKRVVLASDPY